MSALSTTSEKTAAVLPPVVGLLLRIAQQFVELSISQRLLHGELHPYNPDRPEAGGLDPMTRTAYLELQMQAAAFSSCSATAFLLFDIFSETTDSQMSIHFREAWPSLVFRGGIQHNFDLLCRFIRVENDVPRPLLDMVRGSHASWARDILPVLEASRTSGSQKHHCFMFSLRDMSQVKPWATEAAFTCVSENFKKLPVASASASREWCDRLLSFQARGRCSTDHTFVVLQYPVPNQEQPMVLLLQSSAYAYELHDWLALMLPELRRRATCSELTTTSTFSDPRAHAAVATCHPHVDVRTVAQEELQKADAFRTPWIAGDKKWKQFLSKLGTVCTAQTWTTEVAQAFLGLFGVKLDKVEGSALVFSDLNFPAHVHFQHHTWTEASANERLHKLEAVWRNAEKACKARDD